MTLIFAVRHEGGKNQWMRVPRKQLSVQLGSAPLAVGRSNLTGRSLGNNSPLLVGEPRSQAVTRVNPEHASK